MIILALYYLTRPKWEIEEEPYVKLYLSQKNKVISLSLEEYVKGAVAAEMPASFELEALKAQAVCARTYAVRKILKGQKYREGADLSDNVNECQAYISEEEFKDRHPYDYKKLYKKIDQAVRDTRGIIIIYDDEPIDALYHSTCGGRTASGEEIWGNKIPYLVSCSCEYCKSSPYYKTIKEICDREIKKELGLTQNVKTVEIIQKTKSGRVRKLKINDQIIEANYFRQKLGLPSTWWEFTLKKDVLLIKSRGYGHGVGMCQYGAQGMAQKGYHYEDILKYYYKDIKFCQIDY
ncbi:stage II sporulation protein D [Thermosyntropha lipolytica DSM 11003]|uniref:Stage II sporulation protein D n=1 Tax=Thermosyntropha lipolytica DSM 11003 TaxID=1123382 RepID=A0A1M5NT43_9FIRM|nr:stage II sporulation protein D [Thermosyntropha lipolytica]SHG92702.1 stage II sporulation protein D [Thermosyntropha lipolytica DSM 11003]